MLLTRVLGVWLARIGHWPTLQWHQFHKLDQDRLSFRHLAVVVPRARGSSDAGTPPGQSSQRASPPSVVQSPRATCLPQGFYDGVGRWEHTLACGPFTTRRRALQIRDRETLPDSLNDVDYEWWEDVLCGRPFHDPGQVACLLCGAPGGHNTNLAVETRWLPHACIYEHWQTCNTMFPDTQSCLRYFWATWHASWSHKLSFRGQSQHAVCSRCKLIIPNLAVT